MTINEEGGFDVILRLAGATEGKRGEGQLHLLADEINATGLASQHATSIKKFVYSESKVVYRNLSGRHVDESFPVEPMYCTCTISKINAESWLKLYQ